MTKNRTDTNDKVQDAINVIIAHGEKRLSQAPPGHDIRAQGFGITIAPYFSPRQIIELAGAALEDINYHREAAAVRSLLKPNKGGT